MSLNIILRTVCGCERILEIPFSSYPPKFSVPYIRKQNWHVFPKDGESCMAALDNRRDFELSPSVRGLYGYQVYTEVEK